jgi:hypothetical protein
VAVKAVAAGVTSDTAQYSSSKVAVSTSELRPVRLLLPSWGEQQQQQGPLPLPSNNAEKFFLRVDGKALADWMFYVCWTLQMAALIVSR